MNSATTTKETQDKIRSIGGVRSKNSYAMEGIKIEQDQKKAELFVGHFGRTRAGNWEEIREVNEEISRLDKLRKYKGIIIEKHEVLAAIKKVRNTAQGGDTLRNCPETIVYEIVEVFNISWTSGIVPGDQKKGIVCPIPKPGKDSTQVCGYRIITMLPCLGKLLERVLLRRVNYFLESNNLLQPMQIGFRGGKSTIDAVNIVTNEIKTALCNKEFCIVI